MAPAVAEVLARLNQRGYLATEDDVVFHGMFGGYLDASALYRRYKAALKRTRPARPALPRPAPHLRHIGDQ
jgi:hypothetical protein